MSTFFRNFAPEFKKKLKFSMDITIEFLKAKHAEYNKKYFGGKLKTPKFVLFKSKRLLGMYAPYRNSIKITTYYKLDEKKYCTTLLHEMIHQYIYESKIKDTSPHGKYFKAYAADINRDGWNITPREPNNLLPSIEPKENDVFLFTTDTNRHFIMSYSAKYKNTLIKWLRTHYNFTSVISARILNSKYDTLPKCRTNLRGWYISAEEYETLIKSAQYAVAI